MNVHATSSTTDGCVPLAPEELLYENVLALVDHPDEVRIETQLSADKKICTLIVHTHPSDRGKVIGSEGRAVRTLRDLFGRIAASRGMRIMIVVSDADDTAVEEQRKTSHEAQGSADQRRADDRPTVAVRTRPYQPGRDGGAG